MGKIQAAVEWIRSNVKDEKLVVFAYHIEVQEVLIDTLEIDGQAPLSITGEMSARARRDNIQRFQEDDNSRVIICSLKAAQTAITLTAARLVLMVELDWTPAALEQAEDRVHRIGQNRQVVITYLRARDTLDDRMATILENKRTVLGALSATSAPFGYLKNGTPRKQLPGPGRPRLDPKTRAARRRASKAGWQGRNSNYMKEYMRQRRLEIRIKEAKGDIDELQLIQRLGYAGMARQMGGVHYYRMASYESDLIEATAKAEKAQRLLDQVAKNGKDEKVGS